MPLLMTVDGNQRVSVLAGAAPRAGEYGPDDSTDYRNSFSVAPLQAQADPKMLTELKSKSTSRLCRKKGALAPRSWARRYYFPPSTLLRIIYKPFDEESRKKTAKSVTFHMAKLPFLIRFCYCTVLEWAVRSALSSRLSLLVLAPAVWFW